MSTTLSTDEYEDLMEELSLSPQVRRGILFLTEKMPDWLDHLIVPRLDLGECEDCVLGQLFAAEWLVDYEEAKADGRLPIATPFTFGQRYLHIDDARWFGFDQCSDLDDFGYDEDDMAERDYEELTHEWATFVTRVRND